MRGFRAFALLAGIMATTAMRGQTIDGDVVGTVFDATGAVVANASVGLKNDATGVTSAAKAGSDGIYRINNLPVGGYTVTFGAPNFTNAVVKNVQVELNKTTTVNANLQPATVKTEVTVAEAPVLLNTTTAQIGATFTDRFAEDLAVATNAGNAALNLALLSGGVASSGGVGAGDGPSIGGQRPRSNNFTVEGVDDNRKDITGPTTLVPNEAVAEFTILQNQYSAEFGHSAGGQFNTVIKGGTNDLHGSPFRIPSESQPERGGSGFGPAGNPLPTRAMTTIVSAPKPAARFAKIRCSTTACLSTTRSAWRAPFRRRSYAPTAAGYQLLANSPGISQTNLNILQTYLPAAPVQPGHRFRWQSHRSAGNIAAAVAELLQLIQLARLSRLHDFTDGSVTRPLHRGPSVADRYVRESSRVLDAEGDHQRPGLTLGIPHIPTESAERGAAGIQSIQRQRSRFRRFHYPGLESIPNIVIYNDLGVQLGPDRTRLRRTFKAPISSSTT